MSSEVPVVATDVGGLANIIQDGKSGILVPSGNVDSLSKAISAYIQNKGLRKKHGQKSRDLVLEKFSLKSMSQQYINLYDTLLRKKAW